MLPDVSLGRYYETDSVIHRLDPRIKVFLYVIYIVATFMIGTVPSLALMGMITIVLMALARIPFKVMASTVLPVLPIVIFIFIINLLTLRTGDTIWEWWIIKITDYGICRAVLMAIRLLLLIISTSILLTLTTTPLRISDSLESIFAPLKVIKVPVGEMAMMMSIALRFIPTLIRETQKIMRAQVSRGADYDTGSFANRIRGYITVLIPLFISCFRRAEELAVAMDARCFTAGEKRTKLNPLKLRVSDVILGILFVLMLAGTVTTDYILR